MVVKFGIEIEAFANKQILYEEVKSPKLDIQPYHRGNYGHMRQLPSWRFESDSSLRATDSEFKYIEKETFEAVTKPFKIQEWEGIYNEFKTLFTGDKDIEFNKVLAVNDSCGCHIHFSSTTNSHKTFLSYSHLKKIKREVDKYIRTTYPDIYKAFVKSYKRTSIHGDSYCKVLKQDYVDYLSRRVEWNMTNLDSSNRGGIEWRAFNLAGIQTWEQLNNILYNTFLIIEKVIKNYERSSRKETLTLKVPKSKIESIYDMVVL